MIKFFGPMPPAPFSQLKIGGHCPHCKTGSRYTVMSGPYHAQIASEHVNKIVVSYACDTCKGPVPVHWDVVGFGGGEVQLANPVSILKTLHPYDFEHVPEV